MLPRPAADQKCGRIQFRLAAQTVLHKSRCKADGRRRWQQWSICGTAASPKKKNALRDVDFLVLTALAQEVAASDARCLMITGAGGTFCAGRDISTADVAATDAEALIREKINPLFVASRNIPVPTIAVVDGACVGGGFGIAFACDIILAAGDSPLARGITRT